MNNVGGNRDADNSNFVPRTHEHHQGAHEHHQGSHEHHQGAHEHHEADRINNTNDTYLSQHGTGHSHPTNTDNTYLSGHGTGHHNEGGAGFSQAAGNIPGTGTATGAPHTAGHTTTGQGQGVPSQGVGRDDAYLNQHGTGHEHPSNSDNTYLSHHGAGHSETGAVAGRNAADFGSTGVSSHQGQHSGSGATGQHDQHSKPSAVDKIRGKQRTIFLRWFLSLTLALGTAETVIGKAIKNPDLVEKGIERKVCSLL